MEYKIEHKPPVFGDCFVAILNFGGVSVGVVLHAGSSVALSPGYGAFADMAETRAAILEQVAHLEEMNTDRTGHRESSRR